MSKLSQIVFIILLLSSKYNAQQLFNYSHNLLIPGIQNPSFTSHNDEIDFALIRKSVFSTFDGAPEDNSFYFSAPLNNKNGIGLFLNQNTQGLFKEVHGSISYGRSFKLTDFLRLGLGISGIVKSQTINLDQVIAFDLNDPFLVAGVNQSLTYDATFGMYLSSSKFLFRVSAPQLIGNRYDNGYEKLNQHLLSNIQYKFSLKKNFLLTTFAGFDYTLTAPYNYNGGFLLHYKTYFWIGAQYKSDYSISPLIGFNYKKLSIGYSYDYTQLNYTDLGLGHEIMLQYQIHRNTNKYGNISSEAAEGRVLELIDEYFDVQNSKIDILEKKALMRKIKKEIHGLLPFIKKEKKKQLENKIK